jgi:hypothetical protein
MNHPPEAHTSCAHLLPVLALGWCVLTAGCAGTGNYERAAERGETELRGLLEITTNAPPPNIAVLHSRVGTRPPCALRALNTGVAEDLQTLAAKGRTVIVTGAPRGEIFVVTAVREDGKRRPRPAAGDEDAAEGKSAFWPNISWGNVPSHDR